MLTPDQIGLRLDRAAAQAEAQQHESALRTVVNLLREVLPDLLTLASGRSYDDAGRRYGDRDPFANHRASGYQTWGTPGSRVDVGKD